MLKIDDKYRRATVDNIVGYTASTLSDKHNIPLAEILTRLYLTDFMMELDDLATGYCDEDLTKLVEQFEQELGLAQ